MLIEVNGSLGAGVSPRDVILAIIGKIGTAGGTGHVVEYAGSTFRAMSMEGRMTVCNMTIEAGGPPRPLPPREAPLPPFKGPPFSPKGAAPGQAPAPLEKPPPPPRAPFHKTRRLD